MPAPAPAPAPAPSPAPVCAAAPAAHTPAIDAGEVPDRIVPSSKNQSESVAFADVPQVMAPSQDFRLSGSYWQLLAASGSDQGRRMIWMMRLTF